MTTPAAEDRHYPAALYELVHRGTPGDLAFYRDACRGARSVLELGCGYGRVLAALAADPALALTGLELDAELLASARRRLGDAARLVGGDMRDFSFPDERFDRILIPHSGLYCLDAGERVACLRACAAHLAPGGRIVLDAWAVDAFHAGTDPGLLDDERLDPVVGVEHEGTAYDVFERTRWHRDEQRMEVAYEYIPRGGGEALLGRLVVHYLLQPEIEPLLRSAGLALESLHGDFEGGAAGPDAEMWVARARHPST